MNPPQAAPLPRDDQHRTRRLLASAAVAIVAVGIVAYATVAGSRQEPLSDPNLGVFVGAAVSGVEVTTTTEAPATTARPAPVLELTPITEPPLPLPDPLPTDPFAPTPRVVLGTISIPKLGVQVTLLEGMTLTSIDQGTGHWPGTPKPGELGNMVIAGHRTLYQKPFNRLNELVEGDQVHISTPDGQRLTYGVRAVIVVPASSVGIASQARAHTATLFACHPVGKATHRIVAKLALLGSDGKFVDDEAALPPLDVGLRDVDSTVMVRADPDAPSEPGQDPLSAANQ